MFYQTNYFIVQLNTSIKSCFSKVYHWIYFTELTSARYHTSLTPLNHNGFKKSFKTGNILAVISIIFYRVRCEFQIYHRCHKYKYIKYTMECERKKYPFQGVLKTDKMYFNDWYLLLEFIWTLQPNRYTGICYYSRAIRKVFTKRKIVFVHLWSNFLNKFNCFLSHLIVKKKVRNINILHEVKKKIKLKVVLLLIFRSR